MCNARGHTISKQSEVLRCTIFVFLDNTDRLRYSSPRPNCAAALDNDVTKFLHRSGAHNGGHGALHPHAHAPIHPCCPDGIVSEYLLEAISYLPSCAPLYPPLCHFSRAFRSPYATTDIIRSSWSAVFRLNCFS